MKTNRPNPQRHPRTWRAALVRLAPALAAAVAGVATAEAPAPTTGPGTAPQATSANTSYEVGVLLGNQLEHNGLASKLALAELIQGLKEGLAGREQSPSERDATLHFMRESHESLAAANTSAAQEFLTRNAKEANVVSLPSGLQYRVLTPGDSSGKAPGPTDEVTVRYRARLADGHEFDRSDEHDRPARFHVNSVLKGWQEALLAMHPGAKWQLFVPPELGYGANTPPGVPPGSVLIYELELLRIEPAPPIRPSGLRQSPPANQ